jgi:hypothetical protein
MPVNEALAYSEAALNYLLVPAELLPNEQTTDTLFFSFSKNGTNLTGQTIAELHTQIYDDVVKYGKTVQFSSNSLKHVAALDLVWIENANDITVQAIATIANVNAAESMVPCTCATTDCYNSMWSFGTVPISPGGCSGNINSPINCGVAMEQRLNNPQCNPYYGQIVSNQNVTTMATNIYTVSFNANQKPPNNSSTFYQLGYMWRTLGVQCLSPTEMATYTQGFKIASNLMRNNTNAKILNYIVFVDFVVGSNPLYYYYGALTMTSGLVFSVYTYGSSINPPQF